MTRKINKSLALGAALLLGAGPALAQMAEPVDIGLFQNGNELEVRLRPSTSFDGVVSAVVFTIRWEHAGGAQLSDMMQKDAAQQYLPTHKAGNVQESGSYSYQVYAGFGMEPLSDRETHWEAGQEYTIASIPCSGGADYELVNDSWTGEDAHNGDFFLSLGGVDHTGSIYKSLVSAGGDVPFSVTPNPSRGIFTLVIPAVAGEEVSYEVVNSAGQVVAKKTLNTEAGPYREEMDLTNFGAATYHLRVYRNGATETHKIMIN